ncbi:DUF3857 domain-containing protein [Algoriphagus sp. PAP.12]|uniref:DUF3857 domain-containing protein n=1 Tax=Algoriphagus sp. PAP.12 TaxID=2996678 RepID=UPI00227C90AD|nr:DUF3857 domain-containing protein [Algoriphagus sp. PAP.12]
MKLRFLPVLFFFTLGSVFGQKVKMGVFSKEEINLTEVSFEKEADAVILWEQGQSRFNSNLLETTIFSRIKILKESGKSQGTIKIPFYVGTDRTENINGIKAFSINFPSGTPSIEEVAKENIFEVDLPNGWKEIRITFPNVQVGTILEYSYKKTDKNIGILDGWSFQNDIPTLGSSYEITMVPYYDYKLIGQGVKYFTTAEKTANNGTYGWVLRDLHSLCGEPFMKNYIDYRERVEFQLSRYQKYSSGAYTSGSEWIDVLSTWQEVGNRVLEDFQEMGFFRSNPLEKETLDLDLSGASEKEKAKKAYYFFQNNFSISDFQGFWPEQTISQLLKTKKGTPEELNLALMGVLKSIGIECSPLLIGSKGNGRNELVPFPFMNQFNEIILLAQLDGEPVYLDLSDPLAPFGYVGLEKHVKGGLLLAKDNSELVAIKIKHNSNSILMSDVQLSEEGKLEIRNTMRTYFYEGLKIARASKPLIDRNEPLENLFGKDDDFLYSNVKIDNALKEKNYLSTEFTVTSKEKVKDEWIQVSPFSFSSFAQNPFTQEYRVFPVDFDFAFVETYNAKIKTPPGYEIDDYPLEEKMTISSGQISFSYSPTVIDGSLNIIARIEVKDPIIDPKLYGDLKFLMESIASKLNAPVIFKKNAKP